MPINPEARNQLIVEFSEAIGTNEGFYLTESECRARKQAFPTVAQRHNNPGNLRAWGSYPIEDGYAQFDKLANGWQALRRQCERNIFDRDLTFLEFFAGQRNPDGSLVHPTQSYSGFAPASDADRKHGINHPQVYAQFVFDRLKASPSFKSKDWTTINLNSKIKSLVA
jgi:hypothetical protein